MNDRSRPNRTALWAVLVAAQMACVPVPTPRLTPSPSAAPTNSRPPMTTPTRTPTPLVPTSTPTASSTPASSPTFWPTPTSASIVPVSFNSIQMMDIQTGWAVADVGSVELTHILRTEDGGATWRDVSPVDEDFYNPYFLDAQTAWAWSWDSGPTWRTLDGGRSWVPVGEFGWSPDIGFVDSEQGWKLNAEAGGLSFRLFDIISFSTTQDGGMTWQETNPPPGWGSAYMAYPDARTAWALRAGFAKTSEGIPNLGVPFRLETTFDGGSTWTTREMPLPPEAIRLKREYEGTYLGGAGNCEFVSPVYSSTAIWKVALTCETSSWMYTTASQGKTWIISPMPAGIDVTIEFINPTVGWLFVGGWSEDYQGNLYQTTNGGQSWTLIKRTGWGDVRLSFVDEQAGWAVACTDGYCYQPDTERALTTTTDGGLTWQILEPQLAP